MIRARISYLIIPITTFILLFTVLIILYEIIVREHHTLVENQVFDIGKFISNEFKNIYKSDVSRLENLKDRLEFTNGAYYSNWENDAHLILNQNPSFKFIEWIDSSMVIRKITPLKGNEDALNLDISKIDYRKDEWIKYSKSDKTNITPWAKLTQSGNAFLVDVPVYYNNKFQGTITAGMDFKTNFDTVVEYLNNQFSIELYDEKGTLFYNVNKDIVLNKHHKISYSTFINLDDSGLKTWQLKVVPTEKLKIEDGEKLINLAFFTGLFLSIIVSLLVHFYLKTKKSEKQAIQTNLELVLTNEKLNISRDRAEKASQAKTEFLSNMSHEIRTPLHAILGFIQLIKNSKLSKVNKEYLDLMDKSSNNLLNLVNDILDIDKIESGSVELNEILFNPLEKIKELIEVNQFLFLKKNLYLKTNFENTLGMNVLGDQNKMLQIVNNILKNALKFTNKGGVIFTYSEKEIENQLQVNINIKDTGIGIPKEKIETIFNRFTQIDSSIKKQYEGSGLGLAICKHLITMMGGEITIESKLKKGSIFKISTLFKIAKNQEKETSIEIKKNINLSDLSVLIVDDNNINIIVLKKLLETMDIKADTAENGKIALKKVAQKNYQLIFMDIHMPEMDGFETTEIIRKRNKDVIIFGLSANVTTEAINKAILSGMNNYIPKPFKKELLYKMLLFHFNNN
ncbi:response regulator [Confluentibacter sediminis]|uniref:response regulator n=1 Tax=Confluentibacter sediminis TaxID=2219045 RepID=UPI000DAB7ED2|nr:response regulator [Confluentibacter sediminis]